MACHVSRKAAKTPCVFTWALAGGAGATGAASTAAALCSAAGASIEKLAAQFTPSAPGQPAAQQLAGTSISMSTVVATISPVAGSHSMTWCFCRGAWHCGKNISIFREGLNDDAARSVNSCSGRALTSLGGSWLSKTNTCGACLAAAATQQFHTFLHALVGMVNPFGPPALVGLGRPTLQPLVSRVARHHRNWT